MRIVSFNCAGLSRYDVPQLIAELGSPDVVCLQEVRLTDRAPFVPGYVVGASLHPAKKMYGVVTYAREATFATAPWDREGRLLFARVGELIVLNVTPSTARRGPTSIPSSGATAVRATTSSASSSAGSPRTSPRSRIASSRSASSTPRGSILR